MKTQQHTPYQNQETRNPNKTIELQAIHLAAIIQAEKTQREVIDPELGLIRPEDVQRIWNFVSEANQ